MLGEGVEIFNREGQVRPRSPLPHRAAMDAAIFPSLCSLHLPRGGQHPPSGPPASTSHAVWAQSQGAWSQTAVNPRKPFLIHKLNTSGICHSDRKLIDTEVSSRWELAMEGSATAVLGKPVTLLQAEQRGQWGTRFENEQSTPPTGLDIILRMLTPCSAMTGLGRDGPSIIPRTMCVWLCGSRIRREQPCGEDLRGG